MDPHPLSPLAEQLDPDAVFLLRAVRRASPDLQSLALKTAPASIKNLLHSHQLVAGEPELHFTALGFALIDFLPALTSEERAELAQRVDRLLTP